MKIHSVIMCMISRLYDFMSLKLLTAQHRFTILEGPMGCGKTTLIRTLPHALYLDGRSPQDRNLLAAPALDLHVRDGLVIVDEAQYITGLQAVLLPIAYGNPGIHFLLVGSVDRPPMDPSVFRLYGLRPWDVGGGHLDSLWFRGGVPASFDCATDLESVSWRQDHVRQAAEKACPAEGHRFLSMLAYRHGGVRNFRELARSFQCTDSLVYDWSSRMEDAFLIRRLKPWKAETRQRQIRKEKLYIRDCGILHSLLGIEDRRQLLSHPACAASWEGFALEWIAASIGKSDVDLFHWGTSNGNVVHLVWRNEGKLWGVLLHYGCNPLLRHHVKEAVRILGLEHLWIVHTGWRSFHMQRRVSVVPLRTIGPRWNYSRKLTRMEDSGAAAGFLVA